jgi:hypothetical protein
MSGSILAIWTGDALEVGGADTDSQSSQSEERGEHDRGGWS